MLFRSVTAIGMGRPEIEMRAGILTLFINPVLSLLFLFLLGFQGALIATSFTLSLGAIYLLYLFQRIFIISIREYFRYLLFPFISATISLLIVDTVRYRFFMDIFSSPGNARVFVVSGMLLFGILYYSGLRINGHIDSPASILSRYKYSA